MNTTGAFNRKQDKQGGARIPFDLHIHDG